jgi:Acetyltransferases, including N-acetylases of ribosomal proteins
MWELEKEEMAQFIIASHSPILISYYLDSLHNGKGYMTEAAKLAVRFAFSELNLHRIEAGVMPHNIGSMRVLEKVGFHKEGIARKNVNLLNITLL